jgi:hypothetical protein
MLSEGAVGWILRLFVYSDRFLLTPYEWDAKRKVLKWTTSLKHFIFYILVIVYYTGDCVYLTFVMHRIAMDPSVSFDVTMKVCIHWFTRVVTLTLHYSILESRQGFADFYNEFFKFHALLLSRS